MTNWINNIVIEGPSQKILNLWDEIQKTKTLLNVLSNQPHKEFYENGIPNWYQCSKENWFTKWDVNTENLFYQEIGYGSSYIYGWFNSAWNPPIKAYKRYCLDNRDIQISSFYNMHQECYGFLFDGINKEYEWHELSKENLKYLFPKEILDEFTIEDEYELQCEMLEW